MKVSAVGLDVVVKRTFDIPFVKLDEDLLAMDESAGKCYSLNVTAARIWNAIESPTSVGSLCGALSSEFEVSPQTCLSDISELLVALREAGLIELSHGASD